MKPDECLQLNLAQFNELVTNYRQRFIHFALTYTQNEYAAEDVVMEAFMALWEKRALLPTDTNIMSYILTSIKNRCINYLKHESVAVQAAESMKNSYEWGLQTRLMTLNAFDPDSIYSKEIISIVREALKDLSPTTRRVFLMSRVSGKPYKKIADELNMTEKGIEFHIGRALKVLRIALKEYMCVLVWMFLLCPEKLSDLL